MFCHVWCHVWGHLWRRDCNLWTRRVLPIGRNFEQEITELTETDDGNSVPSVYSCSIIFLLFAAIERCVVPLVRFYFLHPRCGKIEIRDKCRSQPETRGVKWRDAVQFRLGVVSGPCRSSRLFDNLPFAKTANQTGRRGPAARSARAGRARSARLQREHRPTTARTSLDIRSRDIHRQRRALPIGRKFEQEKTEITETENGNSIPSVCSCSIVFPSLAANERCLVPYVSSQFRKWWPMLPASAFLCSPH